MFKCGNCGSTDFERDNEEYFCLKCNTQSCNNISLRVDGPGDLHSSQDTKKQRVAKTSKEVYDNEVTPVISVLSQILRKQCDQLINNHSFPTKLRKIVFNFLLRFLNSLGLLCPNRTTKVDKRIFYRRDLASIGICKQRHTNEEISLIFSKENIKDSADNIQEHVDLANTVSVQTNHSSVMLQDASGPLLQKSIINRRFGLRHTLAILILSFTLMNLPKYLFHLCIHIRNGDLSYTDAESFLHSIKYADRSIFEVRAMPNEKSILSIAKEISNTCNIKINECKTSCIMQAYNSLKDLFFLPKDLSDMVQRLLNLCPPGVLKRNNARIRLSVSRLEVISITLAYVACCFTVYIGEPTNNRWDDLSTLARILNRKYMQHKYFVVTDWVQFVMDYAEFQRSVSRTEQAHRKRKLSDLCCNCFNSTNGDHYSKKSRLFSDSLMASVMESNYTETFSAPVYVSDTRMACFPSKCDIELNKLIKSDGIDLTKLMSKLNSQTLRRHADCLQLPKTNKKKESTNLTHLNILLKSMCEIVHSDFDLTRLYYRQIWTCLNNKVDRKI